MLTKGGELQQAFGDLLPKTTKFSDSDKCLKKMVGTSGFEPLTSTVSKFKYSVIQQLTGYLGLPKSLIILHDPLQKRNRCGTESLTPLLSRFAGFERF